MTMEPEFKKKMPQKIVKIEFPARKLTHPVGDAWVCLKMYLVVYGGIKAMIVETCITYMWMGDFLIIDF